MHPVERDATDQPGLFDHDFLGEHLVDLVAYRVPAVGFYAEELRDVDFVSGFHSSLPCLGCSAIFFQ